LPREGVVEEASMAGNKRKSMLLAVLLTFVFGPVGMLYSTVIGALVMLAITAVLGVLTGLGFFFTWPFCIIWSIVAVRSFNRS
jgi:hypothetical protein